MRHIAIATGRGQPKNPLFKGVNTDLGKSRTPSSAPAVRAIPNTPTATLQPTEWRFNRRFDLAQNVQRLARVAGATAPVPDRIISPK